jgi:hypothetical protein
MLVFLYINNRMPATMGNLILPRNRGQENTVGTQREDEVDERKFA